MVYSSTRHLHGGPGRALAKPLQDQGTFALLKGDSHLFAEKMKGLSFEQGERPLGTTCRRPYVS
jgi:hypothetical protein